MVSLLPTQFVVSMFLLTSNLSGASGFYAQFLQSLGEKEGKTSSRQLRTKEENCTEWPVKKVKGKPIDFYSCQTTFNAVHSWENIGEQNESRNILQQNVKKCLCTFQLHCEESQKGK